MTVKEGPAPHVMQTVESIAAIHAKALAAIGPHQRWVERLTARLGTPSSIYVVATSAALWIAVNAAIAASGRAPLDAPPYPWLQGIVGISALLTTTMVLTAQNRQTKDAEQRAQLELQVSLLVDAKVTKLIALVEELRRDMPSVPNRIDRTAEEMKATVNPHDVLSALEETLKKTSDDG
jgi:uncharacterized membrane protein